MTEFDRAIFYSTKIKAWRTCFFLKKIIDRRLTRNIFWTDSPSYPPPHRRHRAKSLPVPKGMIPIGGWSANWTLSIIGWKSISEDPIALSNICFHNQLKTNPLFRGASPQCRHHRSKSLWNWKHLWTFEVRLEIHPDPSCTPEKWKKKIQLLLH